VNFPERGKELYALSFAVALHFLLLFHLDSPMPLGPKNAQELPSLNIEIEVRSRKPDDKSDGLSVPREHSSPNSTDQALKHPPLDLPNPVKARDGSNKDQAKTVSELALRAVTQEDLKRWLDDEKNLISNQNSTAFNSFKESFEAPAIKHKPELRYEDGQSSLGGGLFNVRKNGVTCEQITMVPMSMDDALYGTITAVGKCRKEEKIKIEIDNSSTMD
jgi:hypothetical protein